MQQQLVANAAIVYQTIKKVTQLHQSLIFCHNDCMIGCNYCFADFSIKLTEPLRN